MVSGLILGFESNGGEDRYILMACICEHNDRETAEGGNNAGPFNDTNWPSIRHRIPLCKMVNNENHEVTYRDERNDTCIFEGIETT
jgi:hypothetical protein